MTYAPMRPAGSSRLVGSRRVPAGRPPAPVFLVSATNRQPSREDEMPASLSERFWAKVDKRGDDECWPWVGARSPQGYGRFGLDRKRRPGSPRSQVASRVAYELTLGPIPEGLTIDHLCRNPSCVNPAHLEAVTMRENNARSNSSSAQRARQTHCKRGHHLSGDNLYVDKHGWRACQACRHMHREAWRARAKAGLPR